MSGPGDCHTEWRQTEKDKYCKTMLMCGIWKKGYKWTYVQNWVTEPHIITEWLGNLDWHFASLNWTWVSLIKASQVAQMVKNLPTMWETWVRSLHQEYPLEKEMATHFSILAWRIPWTGWLQSMELQRVGHGWAIHTFTLVNRNKGRMVLGFPFLKPRRDTSTEENGKQ